MKKILISSALILIASTVLAQNTSAFKETSVTTVPPSSLNLKTDVLENGVKVIHIKHGEGENPNSISKVQVTYKGMFKDGRLFDQSLEPIEFGLNQVIPCWTVGVQKMKVGGTAKLECPAETAYGKRGAGNIIPPNTPLNFTIKLVAIK